MAFTGLIAFMPFVLFSVTLPDGAGGFISIGGHWRLIPRITFIVLVLALAGIIVFFRWLWDDHELLFGSGTVLAALSTAAMFGSVFMRRHLVNTAALTFLLVAALSIAALVLIAHDWARRQLLIATVVTAAALSLLIVRVGYESLRVPPPWDRARIAAQAKADENALMASAAIATQPDPAALDRAICAVTGHQINAVTGACGTGGPDEITSNRAWVAAKHQLDVELATYRAAVTGTGADKAAVRAVLAQQPGAGGDISVLAAVENGPGTLWGSAFRTAGQPLVPGPLGWIVFGALLLGLFEWLLKANASQLAGPVEVLPGDNDKRLVTGLRVAVLQNVAEPGAAPGAPSANPVTTLLDIASGPLGAVGKIVETVLKVAGRRYGYQVSMDVTTDAPAAPATPSGAGTAAGTAGTAAAGRTTVLVRVKSVSGGITLASNIFTALADEDAVEAAGLWAAGCILNKSSRIPNWAAWNAETAHALSMADSRSDSTISLRVLESALREAPDSGILLARLGHRYELAGHRIKAISCYARAVTAHPHYWVARYRLAAALGAMRYEQGWAANPPGVRQDDLRAVEAAIIALHVNVGDQLCLLQTQNPLVDAPAKFMKLATALLQALATDTRYMHRLVSALRRSERDSTWPSLAPMSTSAARRFHWLVKSAKMSFGDAAELGELSKKAANPGSWWQISYNAACGYALSGPTEDAQKALCLLEQTLVRPGIHQLSADWVKADSALSSLVGDPRFSRFLAQLRPGDRCRIRSSPSS